MTINYLQLTYTFVCLFYQISFSNVERYICKTVRDALQMCSHARVCWGTSLVHFCIRNPASNPINKCQKGLLSNVLFAECRLIHVRRNVCFSNLSLVHTLFLSKIISPENRAPSLQHLHLLQFIDIRVCSWPVTVALPPSLSLSALMQIHS